ncbi:putative peptide transporter ptr2 [Lachnellula suecica]|uniref:Putative peptide transporter ptr2 n=1 Tax=Lachnellula suecica TaxID=602035 RepID=A0A8T9C0U6_9HELO|nr:putative peptide transporter ptr2 [Lachnellula suecica]
MATNICMENLAPARRPSTSTQNDDDYDTERNFFGWTPDIQGEEPTEEERYTLRRVPFKIPWSVYTIGFVELCERLSYYGAQVIVTNFVQQPLPSGSHTGKSPKDGQSGALGLGQRVSTAIGLFNSWWVYIVPLFGAYIADAHLGRYRTICWAVAIAICGHAIMVVSAIPSVITHPDVSLSVFIVGILVMGAGTGTFKPNISPIVVEQVRCDKMVVKELPSGERVILDPASTRNRVYNYYYLFTNIGALIGAITMVYCEKYVGYWLAYLLPTSMLLLCPLVLFLCRKRYVNQLPHTSVLSKTFRLFFLANKGRWSLNPVTTYHKLHDGTFWSKVKPSAIDPDSRPIWMTFDDQWVDEVARGFAACSVFCWYPIYWLSYDQMDSNLVSQSAVMKLMNGVPNDVINNIDPLALVVLIPFLDLIIYPALRKARINFTPIKRITMGYLIVSMGMVWASVLQSYIYKMSICGTHASGKLPAALGGDGVVKCPNVEINVWIQTGVFALIAMSEILVTITSLEYAFSKAPVNMRSLVMSVCLFTHAISSALGNAFVSLSADPLLVWNYGVLAVLAFLGGIGFWLTFRKLDQEEDQLNMLPVGHVEIDEEYWRDQPTPPTSMDGRFEKDGSLSVK